MSAQGWQETLVAAIVDGPTLTSAAAASCIPTAAKITLPNNYLTIGRVLRLTLHGRISCVVTTPGTARFDVRLGGSVVAWDSGALNLNIVAKTNVPFLLEVLLTVRAQGSGTSGNMMGVGNFQSEAVIAAAANAAGGNGALLCPVGAPAVGTGYDSTVAQSLDVFFTQTVGTGSMTVHQYTLESMN